MIENSNEEEVKKDDAWGSALHYFPVPHPSFEEPLLDLGKAIGLLALERSKSPAEMREKLRELTEQSTKWLEDTRAMVSRILIEELGGDGIDPVTGEERERNDY